MAIAKATFTAFASLGILDATAQMRASVAGLNVLFENLSFVWNNAGAVLITGLGNTPEYLPLACIAIPGACTLLCVLTHPENRAGKFVFALVSTLAIIVLSFSPHYITAAHDLSARTLVGVFVASVALWIAFIGQTKKATSDAFTLAAISLSLIAGIYTCNVGTKVELAINGQERTYSNEVQAAIDEYESSNKTEIRTIIRTSDAEPSPYLTKPNNGLFGNRTWYIATTWTTTYMINTYENTHYLNQEMSPDDKQRLFGSANYDSFDATKQLVFEGENLYLLVY